MASRYLHLRGDRELTRKFQRLSKPRHLKKVMKAATTAGAQVVVRGVRRVWRTEAQDTGFSAKSVEKKIISTKAGFLGIVGIDKDAVATGPGGQRHVPSNIDHLIEFGFQHPNGKTVPAVAPLRRGYDATRAEAEAKFAVKAAAAIEKEAMKR